jgi:predicted AlkP superfamily pyrophosphatase or phosphodiesterase
LLSFAHEPSSRVPVIVLVADGARPDALEGSSLARLPALRRLREEGALYQVSSVFPSVTGPAYTPFLMGRFPGPIGIPGLRWFDRSRTAGRWPDYARSYVGHQMRLFDEDLDPAAPTIFELVPKSLAALSVVTRGLPPERRIGALTARSALRAAVTHFRGRAERWLDVDREIGDEVVQRMREERPDFLFAAFTGVDKASHARGHEDALVHDALAIVDDVAGRLRDDAERGGWWDGTHLWLVSDHGHAPVHTHEDLAAVVAQTGRRTVSHPWSAGIAPDAAVMVSGNAMAHVYVELEQRERAWWPALASRHEPLAAVLLARASVDLLLLPHGPNRCEVRSATRGSAFVEQCGDRFRYARQSGDPLGIGTDVDGDSDAVYDATIDSTYPAGIVQIVTLAGSARAGDLIVSSTPGWDFRARYEPIPHRSAHGALHRDHMMVPLLTNRRAAGTPRRTTDVFASALDALGVAAPEQMDGRSFLGTDD